MRFITILLLAITSFSCKQDYVESNTATTEESAVPVKVAELRLSRAPLPIVASGTVAGKEEMKLSFKVGGIIERMYADEGQRVRKGQLLAKLRTTEIDAQVLKARQAADKARRDLERIEKLYQDTAATLEQVQDLRTALEVAEADLEIAEFNQEYARIVAPVPGRILQRFTEPNELIEPGTPIFALASSAGQAFILEVGVADKHVMRLKLGDRAEARFDALPGDPLPAVVSEMAEAADPRTGTFPIELSLRPGQRELRNGFIGTVRIFPSQQAPYFPIPMDALVEGYQTRANIFVPDSNGTVARKMAVNPQYIGKNFFTVPQRQLDSFRQVITGGSAYLRDGAPIRVIGAPDTTMQLVER